MDNEILKAIREMLKEELTPIRTEIKELRESIEVQFKITNGLINGATNKIDDLKSHIDSVEANNAARHTSIESKLNELDTAIAFLKHKENKNEEELFTIKRHLTIVK